MYSFSLEKDLIPTDASLAYLVMLFANNISKANAY